VYRVSPRGQFSLPADARRRWGIEHGGDVELFDLGGCVVMLPLGDSSARASLAKSMTADRYRHYVEQVADPELHDE